MVFYKNKERERERERGQTVNRQSEREVSKRHMERKCVKEHNCSFKGSLHVTVGHHSTVRSTFPGQGLLVTLMAWKEDHDTLSPRRDANIAVAFVSSAPSLLHNSLDVTN